MTTVRRAGLSDSRDAVDLLMEAAGALLMRIFGNGDEAATRQFLANAWQAGEGQYGYQNHWVAESDHAVVGLITSWHDQLPQDFDRKTLDIITQHFGLDEALDIVMRSQRYSSALHSPTSAQMAIGHVAVTHGQRGLGIGKKLLEEMTSLARRYNKTALVLDVETTNHDAIRFYTRQQFIVGQVCAPFQQMIRYI